jgi:hypothetical protein
MEPLLPAYKAVGEQRYRETNGLYWEDFEPGDVFEHRPGRTVLDVDNTWFTLLTMNIQQVHFDAAYAAKTEWKKPLVDSTFTLALLTSMSVRTVMRQGRRQSWLGQGQGHPSGLRRRHALCRKHRAPQTRVEAPSDARDRHGAEVWWKIIPAWDTTRWRSTRWSKPSQHSCRQPARKNLTNTGPRSRASM